MAPAWLGTLVRKAFPLRRLRHATRSRGPHVLGRLEALEPRAVPAVAVDWSPPALMAAATNESVSIATRTGLTGLIDALGTGWAGGSYDFQFPTMPAFPISGDSAPPLAPAAPPPDVGGAASAPPPASLPSAPDAPPPEPTPAAPPPAPATPAPATPPPASPPPPAEPRAPTPPPTATPGQANTVAPPSATTPAVEATQPTAETPTAPNSPSPVADGSAPTGTTAPAPAASRPLPAPTADTPPPFHGTAVTAPTAAPTRLAAATDGTLLKRFAAGREQPAFAELVRRHGPAVQRVCARVLGDADYAQDATQATFLALARRAAALDPRDSLAGWLYRVAARMALRCRATAARRRRVEMAAAERPPRESSDPFVAVAAADLGRAVHEELERLPEKYRVPLVLAYLDGRTHAEVARAVGLPRGSVAKRIGEGLDRLREGLAVRGVRS